MLTSQFSYSFWFVILFSLVFILVFLPAVKLKPYLVKKALPV